MKVALVQFDIVWESKKENYQKAKIFARRAAEEACDIVVFPEMFNTGFSRNIPVIVEEEDGETAAFLSGLARKYRLNLIAGFPARTSDDNKGKNLAVAYDREGNLLAKFIKIHPFSFTKEDQYFIPGKKTVIFSIDGMPSSMFICYDLRFPEVFRFVAKSVQAIFVIANWPTERKEHWEWLLKARAIENQCFVIGVNRTGVDGNRLRYPGASHIFNPLGEDICSGKADEEFLTGAFDPAEVAEVRSKYPFLADMRMLPT